ncbi:hypothetical protein NW762_006364 [Fusarium torreyae]|uniref:Alcohol dehydrogenase-like N-terminal domain-containing protein n=1 Tax=Fusarium torreyae TaxID=1237075 RepID=A0A9W8S1G9_9HYPO|nr:hypothetical protein NW762_006364 [Fusarium torreyae]
MDAKAQKAVVQTRNAPLSSRLPLSISVEVPIPKLSSPHDILVRVLAAAGNPTDFKMVTHFFMEDNVIGCDFCGIIEKAGPKALFPVGTRVCGSDFPYRANRENPQNGAFTEWIVVDSRGKIRVPETWTNAQAAALGGIGWGAAVLALSDPGALNLSGRPSNPVRSTTPILVLIYGAGTATGSMAVQLLTLCIQDIKELAKGIPIKHALDCITDEVSSFTCFSVLSRVGARYACLEKLPDQWRVRKAVSVKVVMQYEMLGYDVDLDDATYTRKANAEMKDIGIAWGEEMQMLVDKALIVTPLVREMGGGLESLLEVVELMRRGQTDGKKLVANISS